MGSGVERRTRRSADGVDGRLSRTLRSRLAICEACLDLIEEGVLQPGAEQIAERAGLSRRSVFNHFSDLAELYDAVVEVSMQRSAPLLKKISCEAPLAERLGHFVEMRGQFFEANTPFTRALTAQSLVGPQSDQARRVALEALNRQVNDVERVFATELSALFDTDRDELVEALAAASNAPMWEYLRRSRGLSMTRSRSVMRRTLTAVLRDAGVEVGEAS